MNDEKTPHRFVPRGTLPAPAACLVCGLSGFDSIHDDNEQTGVNMYCDCRCAVCLSGGACCHDAETDRSNR